MYIAGGAREPGCGVRSDFVNRNGPVSRTRRDGLRVV